MTTKTKGHPQDRESRRAAKKATALMALTFDPNDSSVIDLTGDFGADKTGGWCRIGDRLRFVEGE